MEEQREAADTQIMPSTSSEEEHDDDNEEGALGQLLMRHQQHHHHQHHRGQEHQQQIISRKLVQLPGRHEVKQQAGEEPSISTASTLKLTDTLRSQGQRMMTSRRSPAGKDEIFDMKVDNEGHQDNKNNSFIVGGFSKVRKTSARWLNSLFGGGAAGRGEGNQLTGSASIMATYDCDNYDSNGILNSTSSTSAWQGGGHRGTEETRWVIVEDERNLEDVTKDEQGGVIDGDTVGDEANYLSAEEEAEKSDKRNIFSRNYNFNCGVNLADTSSAEGPSGGGHNRRTFADTSSRWMRAGGEGDSRGTDEALPLHFHAACNPDQQRQHHRPQDGGPFSQPEEEHQPVGSSCRLHGLPTTGGPPPSPPVSPVASEAVDGFAATSAGRMYAN